MPDRPVPFPRPSSPRPSCPRHPLQLTRSSAGLVGLPHPANDNPPPQQDGAASQQALHAALRLFAEHGLGAAAEACRRAEQARAGNDDAEFARWYTICRVLDRRLARTLRRTHGAATPGAQGSQG